MSPSVGMGAFVDTALSVTPLALLLGIADESIRIPGGSGVPCRRRIRSMWSAVVLRFSEVSEGGGGVGDRLLRVKTSSSVVDSSWGLSLSEWCVDWFGGVTGSRYFFPNLMQKLPCSSVTEYLNLTMISTDANPDRNRNPMKGMSNCTAYSMMGNY